MKILAVDYGAKRIGLAIADSELRVPLPFGIIESHKPEAISRKFIELIKKEQIDKVVVGLPLGLDGKENENTRRVRGFVKELKKQIGIPIEFIDERFTSAQADRYEGEASRDEKAAMLFLQSYFEANKQIS